MNASQLIQSADDREQASPGTFKDSLPYKMQLLARILQADYMARIAATGIAPAQAYVLGELWLEEPLSQVELARRLEIGKATMGKTLGRLEAAGFIERKRDPRDRRVIMIALTEKGRSLREPLLGASADMDRILVSEFGVERLRDMSHLASELIDMLRSESQ